MPETAKTSVDIAQEKNTDKFLARALVDRKLLPVSQAKSLLAKLNNGESDKSLEDLLLESDILKEEVILETKASLWNVPFIDLNNYEIDSPECLHLQIEAMKLAFSDAYRYISDPITLEFDPSFLIKSSYLSKRANLIDFDIAKQFKAGMPKLGDTVYLTAADNEDMMVSYIQSNYEGFGSGIVIPGTGISLQNRARGFNLIDGHPNQIGPNKRPYHTIIPAFVTKNGEPLMSFGVMGGSMQPQGHAQMMIRIFQYGQNPQTAIDAPRWRAMGNLKVNLESGFENYIYKDLAKLGHQVSKEHFYKFGGAQIIYKLEEGYLGASDWRKDGQAVGF